MASANLAALARRTADTLDSHLDTLASLRDEARAAGRFGDAISAEVNRGKALGFYVIRSEAGRPGDFSDLTDEQLAEKLRAYETFDETA